MFITGYNINTYMGNKWKLNIQQYVYNENGKYYYINSSKKAVKPGLKTGVISGDLLPAVPPEERRLSPRACRCSTSD